MTEPSHAVFLSYASQDAEAAQKICMALRAVGIEVFLDQSELRGGDVWDQKIRREIQECALFIPVISANTAARHEGYFRLEWDLADQRTHMIARSRVFVVPVCLDTTTEVAADVPESFRRVQWTRLPGGETPPAFVERLKRLLSPELLPLSAGSGAAPGTRDPVRVSRRSKPVLLAPGIEAGVRTDAQRAIALAPTLGRNDAAAAALARVVHLGGDASAYQYAQIHAQWGERAVALEWLEKARHLGDPGLIYLKTDALMDPLRDEPRFQAVMRELKFPD